MNLNENKFEVTCSAKTFEMQYFTRPESNPTDFPLPTVFHVLRASNELFRVYMFTSVHLKSQNNNIKRQNTFDEISISQYWRRDLL